MMYVISSLAVAFGCCLGLSKDSVKAACIFALYALVLTFYLAVALYANGLL